MEAVVFLMHHTNTSLALKNSKIKFIYWFAYYNLDSPSVRYRAKYPLEYFRKKHDIGYYLVMPGYSLKRIIAFLNAYFSALIFPKKDSIIVIQRVHSNFIYSNLLRLLVSIRKQDSVYDLDDADYLENDAKAIYSFAKKCNTISAGSKKIADHLRVYNSRIVHTTSPIFNMDIIKESKSDLFTIGWIGGFGGEHKNSIVDLVFPAMKELEFKFKFILLGIQNKADIEFVNDYFCKNKNVQIEIPTNIDWNDESSIQHIIKTFDIGIATLVDSEMQLSKSGIKAKQYMNNGVPVLSTKLPENDSVVVDGKNGFFCSTSNDFKQRIIEFYQMDEKTFEFYKKNARDSIFNFDHDKYFMDFSSMRNGNMLSMQEC